MCVYLVCCLLGYGVLHRTQSYMREYHAWNLWLQQPVLNSNLVENTTARFYTSLSEDEVYFERGPVTEVYFESSRVKDVYFSSPFIVAETQGEIQNTETPRDTNKTKTFAVIWPCKGKQSRCFINKRVRMDSCPFKCHQVTAYEKADVVVFNVYRFARNEDVPKFNRPSHQRWVMMTPEAPVRLGQFNWTMTYRLDSDIPTLYGRLKQQKAAKKNYDLIYSGKNVTAAWFVSHCPTHSKRELYVQRMQTVIDVHVYGSCGEYTCWKSSQYKRNIDKDQCLPLLSKTYFFYLAFENSLCKDYVTEKFFKIFGDVDVIPVVRGGADYEKYFPPDTFVNAHDFTTPEELSQFLIDLARDKNRYISTLKMKNAYRELPGENSFCRLCEKMHTDHSEKTYPDLRQWFRKDQCIAADEM